MTLPSRRWMSGFAQRTSARLRPSMGNPTRRQVIVTARWTISPAIPSCGACSGCDRAMRLVRRRGAQRVRDMDKLSEGIGAHLFHYAGSVRLYRALGGIGFRGDLLVWLAHGDTREDIALSGREA